jgi:hypothetical protein
LSVLNRLLRIVQVHLQYEDEDEVSALMAQSVVTLGHNLSDQVWRRAKKGFLPAVLREMPGAG